MTRWRNFVHLLKNKSYETNAFIFVKKNSYI